VSELSLTHQPCEKCGSSDAASLNTDGWWHCFSCSARWPGSAAAVPKARPKVKTDLDALIESGEVRALPKRKLTLETCKLFDYRVRINPTNGHAEHLAIYRDDRRAPVAVKIRDTGADGATKTFRIEGDAKAMGIYGSWLWPDQGKMLVITAGEIDAASVSQAFGNKWPVGSVPNGVTAAEKAVKKAEKCAALLPPGKAFIASLPEKDPNACTLAGKEVEITRAAWNAKEYRPDGIVNAKDLIGLALTPPVSGLPWPWKPLTDYTFGRRHGELYTVGAGTGVGKTDFIAQIVAHTISECREPCAVFNYESGPVQTLKAVIGKVGNRRYHIPDPDSALWTEDELRHDLDRLEDGSLASLFINDHFGAVDWESIKERARFLAKAHGVKHFVVDPLTALVAQADDERRELDRVVAEMAALAQELNACFYLVSHLARPSEGNSHEEGGRVKLSQFRGSNAIGMWSFFVFALERNQQASSEEERTKTVVRVLKDRYTGNSTGKTFSVYYNPLTGKLEQAATEEVEPA
jgi:twinkle protein